MSHIRLKIDDADLLADARRVLHEFAPRETEFETEQGRSWLRRVVAYRTLHRRIDGVVVTYHDITHIRQADRQARLLAAVLKDTTDATSFTTFKAALPPGTAAPTGFMVTAKPKRSR